MVVFSSIFYWIKYSRNVRDNEQGLKCQFYPNYIKTTRHASNIEFISNFNDSLFSLYQIPPSVISYLFITGNKLWISYKNDDDQEYLIKIPISTINNIEMNEFSEDNKENNNEQIKSCNNLIFTLSKSAEIYTYYHQHELWICNKCGFVHNINITKDKLCIACKKKLDDNNPYHYYSMIYFANHLNLGKPNLKVQKYCFIEQSKFYKLETCFYPQSS